MNTLRLHNELLNTGADGFQRFSCPVSFFDRTTEGARRQIRNSSCNSRYAQQTRNATHREYRTCLTSRKLRHGDISRRTYPVRVHANATVINGVAGTL